MAPLRLGDALGLGAFLACLDRDKRQEDVQQVRHKPASAATSHMSPVRLGYGSCIKDGLDSRALARTTCMQPTLVGIKATKLLSNPNTSLLQQPG